MLLFCLALFIRVSVHFSFLKKNGSVAPNGLIPVVFQEWTDTTSYSHLKYTLSKRLCKLKSSMYFALVQEDIVYVVVLLLNVHGK